MVAQSLFQVAIASVGALLAAGLAMQYFSKVRLDWPMIGVFNSRDVVALSVFIIGLPILYLVLPSAVLTGFLVVTFLSALHIAAKPIMSARLRWVLIPALLAANIWVTFNLLGSRSGLQVYWLLNSIIGIIAAVGVSNLYVQGGFQLRQVARFALFLGVYDLVFSQFIPLTPQLADAFEGRPLDPAVGFVTGTLQANIGLGDLLLYGLFATAALRGFGRRGALAALGVVGVFGAVVPGLAPLMFAQFVREGVGVVVPAQVFFGPAAFVTYRLLSRKRERTVQEWLAHPVRSGRLSFGFNGGVLASGGKP